MTRPNYGLALIAASLFACGGGGGGGGTGSNTRSVSAQLKVSSTARAVTKSGTLVVPTAGELLALQMKNRPKIRARQSLPFARALAAKFSPLNNKLIAPRPPVSATARGNDAFDASVAVFAYDDVSGVFVDAQYLDVTTGAFDLQVVEDSPVSIWTGTYDMAAGTGNVVLPITYGFEDDIAPATTDVTFTYDPYFYVAPSDASFDSVYAPVTADQSGYYEFAYSGGTSYMYLLADDAAVGSYYMIWDDGTCAQGTQVAVEFDSSGSYFTVTGVDAAFSLSGVADTPGNFGGSNIRWDVVGDNGQTYEDLVTVTYLADASSGPSCPTTALVDPCTSGACSLACPAGCSLDVDFGICTIDGTYDASTGIGVSCELGDLSQSLIVCPSGCAEPVPADGFCYSSTGAICY